MDMHRGHEYTWDKQHEHAAGQCVITTQWFVGIPYPTRKDSKKGRTYFNQTRARLREKTPKKDPFKFLNFCFLLFRSAFLLCFDSLFWLVSFVFRIRTLRFHFEEKQVK
jgi:hypothetical protein